MDTSNIIDQSTLNKIVEHYHLGNIISDPRILKGGLLHQQWKLITSQGNYVIKQLNPEIITKHDAFNRYRISERIAEAYSNIINVVCATVVNNDPLFTVDNHTFMLFPYINAVHINQNEIEMKHVINISDALATMHTAHIKIDNPPEAEDIFIDLSEIHGLTKKLQSIQPDITNKLQNTSQLIISMMNDYKKHKSSLLTNTIISHRDLDAKNVIWDKNNQYYIIDWESAGLINQIFDLLSTAVYWSMNGEYMIDTNYYHSFIQNYLNKTSIAIDNDQFKASYVALLATWINWLFFNFNRILNQDENSAEYNVAVKESVSTLTAIEHIHLQKDQILLEWQ